MFLLTSILRPFHAQNVKYTILRPFYLHSHSQMATNVFRLVKGPAIGNVLALKKDAKKKGVSVIHAFSWRKMLLSLISTILNSFSFYETWKKCQKQICFLSNIQGQPDTMYKGSNIVRKQLFSTIHFEIVFYLICWIVLLQ